MGGGRRRLCVPLPVDQFGRHLLEEPRRRVVRRLAPGAADLRPGQVQPGARPGYADVGEPAFLLEFGGVTERAQVREDAVLQAGEEDHRELQPLGAVQRHQGDGPGGTALAIRAVLGVGHLVGVGDQGDLLEEVRERALRELFAELPGDADQLLEVLHPSLGLEGVRGCQFGEVAGPLQHRLQRRDRAVGHGRAQLGQQGGETTDRVRRPGGQARDLVHPVQGVGEGDTLAFGKGREHRLGPVADPPLGHVEDAPQVHRVRRVHQHPQVGEQVPDLTALVEAHPADHPVGQANSDEDLFKNPALGVGAVEDRDLARARQLGVGEPVDLGGDEGGLAVLVVRDTADDLLAVPGVRPQPLGLAPGVTGYHRVRRGEDRLRGAVVLLQQDHGGVGVVLLELDDVTDVRAPEGVDRLVGVADHAQLGRLHRGLVGVGAQRHRIRPYRLAVDGQPGRLPHQFPHQDVLGVVGVLILVDEDVPEPAPVVLGDVRECLQQVHRRHDQVVEVERVRLGQPALVEPVDLGDGTFDMAGRPAHGGLPVDQLVLQVADTGGERACRIPLGVDVQVARDQRDQTLGVRRVVDREAAGEPDALGVRPQDAHAGGVKGAHPHRPGAGADERGDPLLHLVRGLVGERDRQDLAGADPARGEQVGDPVRQHPRLAGARARDDEQRRARVDDRRPLLRVQAVEQRVGIEPGRGGAAARYALRRWRPRLVAVVGVVEARVRAEAGVRATGKRAHRKPIIRSTPGWSDSGTWLSPYEAPTRATTAHPRQGGHGPRRGPWEGRTVAAIPPPGVTNIRHGASRWV